MIFDRHDRYLMVQALAGLSVGLAHAEDRIRPVKASKPATPGLTVETATYIMRHSRRKVA